MPEFANRAEYEKFKAEMIERLRKEEELREKWVCPQCLSFLPLSCMRCRCGYTAVQSLFPYLRVEITSSELFGIVRNEFHVGNHGTAAFLSSYLTKRFPEAEEARQVREYGEHRRGDIPHRKVPAMKTLRTAPVIAAAFLGALALFVTAFLLSSRSTINPRERKGEHMKDITGSVPANPAGHGMAVEKKTEEEESEVPQSPKKELGIKKGREIAKVFLTNKHLAIEEKCREAMQKAHIQDADYLIGCVKGYDSYGLLSSQSREIRGSVVLSELDHLIP